MCIYHIFNKERKYIKLWGVLTPRWSLKNYNAEAAMCISVFVSLSFFDFLLLTSLVDIAMYTAFSTMFSIRFSIILTSSSVASSSILILEGELLLINCSTSYLLMYPTLTHLSLWEGYIFKRNFTHFGKK